MMVHGVGLKMLASSEEGVGGKDRHVWVVTVLKMAERGQKCCGGKCEFPASIVFIA